MIPKGLKVGDTFKDDGITYKVLKVTDIGYESQMVAAKPFGFFNAVVPEEPKEEASEDYESLPYAQLKKLCADRGLDATGKKADLIARLEG